MAAFRLSAMGLFASALAFTAVAAGNAETMAVIVAALRHRS
ncbi:MULTISPECIES: hypothetical protein [unclassified Mesorhizobium]|nr:MULTISPECIES: hypothetical protein [unclassified Mesorhizobium]